MQINEIIKKFRVLPNIQEHSTKVADVALQIGEQYLQNNYDIDLKVLKNACLLHDLFKIVDFSDEVYEKIKKSHSEEEIQIWDKIREKYQPKPHWEAAYEYLTEIGLTKEAEIIKKHYFNAIVDQTDKPSTIEDKILTYADKRVLHDKIVSMTHRFKDGSERYNNNGLEPEAEQKIHNAYFQLERELFEPIDLTPEDIKS